MRSPLPKVLHPVGNRPLLGHVLAAVEAAGIEQRAVVVGAGGGPVAEYVQQVAPTAQVFTQHEQLGTAPRGARGPTGIAGARTATGLCVGAVWRLTLDYPADPGPFTQGIDRWCGRGGGGFPHPTTGALRAVAGGAGAFARNPRSQRCKPEGAGHQLLQWRRHGPARRYLPVAAGAYRQPERPG
ncbi:hypothetical protein [Pseudomonas sp. GM48]|uniref:hypothetical protein n=1 Tax=Pseudomonas sp. GM48 TaxID=1144330 RepID=UPI001EE65053|nr:hypothetical protein [Pseudomonas sp. GM48]